MIPVPASKGSATPFASLQTGSGGAGPRTSFNGERTMPAYSQGCLSFEFDPSTHEVYRTLDFMGLIGERVSTNGNVSSRKRRGSKRGTLTDTWRTRKLALLHKGYSYNYVSFKVEGKSVTYPVHRLVLLAFMGPCPKGMGCRHVNVRHLNGVRNDNRIENLCWNTRRKDLEKLADQHGIPFPTLYARVHVLGWTLEKAINTSVGNQGRKSKGI
jgi:hypothetical protein